MTHAIDFSRRNFLKLGATGSAALATVSLTATLAGCGARDQAAAQGFRFLRDADLELFRALIPVIVAGALPEPAVEREPLIAETVRRVDDACYRLGAPAQAQLYQLFDLLDFRLTRAAATAVLGRWSEAGPGDIEAFLQRWRHSRIGLFNVGYRALVKLVAASYYGLPSSWRLSGYPGPLAWAYQAVNS